MYESIKRLSRAHGVTPAITLMAAFRVLLSRYTGQEDIVLGSPIANRNRKEIENLIGFFVNTLALRVDLAGNPTFAELLRRERDSSLTAYDHQDFPFERLVDELDLERDLTQNPLFQVLIAVQNVASKPFSLSGLTVTPFVPSKELTARFDMEVYLREDADRLVATFVYNVDLFDASTMERMATHYERLLEAVAADPDARLSSLSMLSEDERRQLVEEWNETDEAYPRDRCIHELFEAQVERTPDHVAVICDSEQLTFGELNRRANQIAHTLRERGVGPESMVGICIERNLDMVAGILGILKAGGAYVPMDPGYPEDRLGFIVRDSWAQWLLTQEDLLQRLPEHEAEVICLDRDRPNIGAASSTNPEPVVRPGNLAYLIYTSGSTGRPKGVAIEHASAANLIHWARGVFEDEALRGVLASTSICFDLSVFELFVPLSWGGTVILAENAMGLPDLACKDQVRLINTVPSVVAELLRQRAIPPSVQTVNLAGEPLRRELVDEVYGSAVARVFDLYGPSETTTYSTGVLRERAGSETIGRPLANEQVYIVDRDMEPVPPGVAGELYIGGAGVARGYSARPELTAERFVPDPFGRVTGARLYRTGDLARYLPDGNIKLLGRVDHQVKLRGYRIELGEIESALQDHPDVREAVAVVQGGPSGEPGLVAYIVPAGSGEDFDHAGLRDWLRGRLPEYMVPWAFITMGSLPLTPNGKIDRPALPRPEPPQSRSYVPPQTETEQILCEIWSEVLGVERVGVEDDFFELGGHSLLATKVASRIRKLFHLALPLKELFEYPTIVGLAREIQNLKWAARSPAIATPEQGLDTGLI